jgi:hypothetical protein
MKFELHRATTTPARCVSAEHAVKPQRGGREWLGREERTMTDQLKAIEDSFGKVAPSAEIYRRSLTTR